MSGFQAYLDDAEAATGITPRAFMRLADERGLTTAKVGAIKGVLAKRPGRSPTSL